MPSSVDPENDFRPGDVETIILRKVLDRMIAVIDSIKTVAPVVTIEPGNVNIGSVLIKDADGLNYAEVEISDPAPGEAGLVTRNIPSGTQVISGTVGVSNFPATQPVSGSLSVSNFPATQPVSGSLSVSNFPATQVVQITGDPENPFFTAARTGLVGGKAAYGFHIIGRRAGFNSTSVLQDVAEFLGASTDAMPELTGAESLEVVSSSANDASAGTGARTIKVTYIDTSNNLVRSAAVTLNGTTPVALAFKSNQILWMEVVTTGSLAVSAGNILLRIAGAGATHEQITAGGNRSLSSHFMVPAGYTAYLTGWQVNAIGGATQDARLRATVLSSDRSINTAYIFQDNCFVSAGSVTDDIPWLACPALSKIKVSTISSNAAGTNRIDSDYTVLLVAN